MIKQYDFTITFSTLFYLSHTLSLLLCVLSECIKLIWWWWWWSQLLSGKCSARQLL